MLSFHSIKLLKEKKVLLRKKHRNKLSPNYLNICADLKILNNKIEDSIKNDYSHNMEKKIKSIIVDNNVYKNIKKITDYKKRSEMPNTLYGSDNMLHKYTTDSEKANALASHFENTHLLTHKQISVMETTVKACYESYKSNEFPVINFSVDIPANFKDNNNFEQIKETHEVVANTHHYFTSNKEIENIIKSCKPKKSSGEDQSSNYILKKMPQIFISTLTLLMNHIINIQYFPNDWKLGVISAICKPNKDKTSITSYRPITQLSSISKLLEKKMESRIRTYCNEKNIINKQQFGFQRNKSTEMAASKFISDVSTGLNNKQPTLAILLDFQAAFDTLWHKALIYKMHGMGFDNNIICLVKSYESNRRFTVQINEKKSSIRNIVAGAPQGGILSAILYLLYTNDFPQLANRETQMNRIMFADDTIVYATTDKIKQAQSDLNLYLLIIANYVLCWKLKLNGLKTESIAIVGQYKDLTKSVRKNALKVELSINNTKIKKCDKVKYLGLIISSNFKSINHINYVIDKVNSAKAQLKTVFENKYLQSNVKLLLYKQLIRPIILYACICWMLTSSHQMEKLRILERWFLRKITNLYKNPNTNKFINSKILYEATKIDRIDRKMVENNIKFIKKTKLNDEQFSAQITNYDANYINNSKYKPLNYIDYLNNLGLLYENKKLLIFNKGSLNPNALVYVVNQNEINF